MLKTYRLIWEILVPSERRTAMLLLVMTIFMAVFEVIGVAAILPFMQVLADPSSIQKYAVLKWSWDFFGFTSNSAYAIFLGSVVFGVIVLGMIVRGVTTYALTRFGMMRSYTIGTRLLTNYLAQPYEWFLSKNSASLGQTLLYETDRAIIDCFTPALLLVSHLFIVVLITAFVFVVQPWIAIGATVLLALAYSAVYLGFRGTLDRLGTERYAANESRFRTVQEATGGIKDVKVQGLEARFLSRFRKPALELVSNETWSMLISRLPRFALEAVVYGGFILMVLLMLVARGGNITDLIPVFGLVGMAASKLFPALQQVYAMTSAMRFWTPSLETLHNNLRTLEAPKRPQVQGPKIRLKEKLEVRDVVFRYPGADHNTLNGLSATIPACTTVGVVGGTGAGKTTVIDLLLGLFTPDAGEVLVDGVALTREMIPGWQSTLGYVPQQIYLTDDSVAANIAFGLPENEIDHDAVIRAAKVANLHDFVMSELPRGYATVVGERGVRLSGGQRQRIGIARALYRDPDVLILDEATSALDNLTERAVMDAVHNLSHQKTIIMIAHRLTTVRKCDFILMLEGGRVIGQGTYDDLVAENAKFRKLAT